MLSTPETTHWLEAMDRALGPELLAMIASDEVTDLCINPDERVFVERVGEAMHDTGLRHPAPKTLGFLRTVAKLVGAELHETKPILETRMPKYGLRLEGMIPPIVAGPALALRKPAKTTYSLESYVETGRMPQKAFDLVLDAVRARRSLLIAGGTGSGKTTFGMAVLRAVGEHTPSDRVLCIEDTPELDLTLQQHVPNTVPTVSGPWASTAEILRASLRMFPTRIAVGEVRGDEALDLLGAWNTGHSGGICTVHANSARDALHRLANLAAQGTRGGFVPRADVARCVNLVLFLARRAGHRGVDQILRVRGLDTLGDFDCEEIYDARSQ